MKVLFLDIDGVLNLIPKSSSDGKFDKTCMINLEYLLNKVTDLKIVVSSAWRKNGLDSVRNTLKENGIDPRKVIDITGDEQSEDEKDHRGYQVECWLKRNPEVKSFAIVDDNTDFVPLKNKLVKTSPHKGLTQANVEKLIEILSE
jgi:hypothetical protein